MTSKPLKIVYLFGAGASHAEITNLYPAWFTDELKSRQESLLLKSVSQRVSKKAKAEGWFERWKDVNDFSDIELFISLIQDNHIQSDQTVTNLQELLREDICSRLTKWRQDRFYLHKALLELHNRIKHKEDLQSIISLNYDDVLDNAYRAVYKSGPNYSLSHDSLHSSPYLLKLHGGFDLKYPATGESIPIIPPGTHKNYLELPYNFIWGRALGTLIECDILRVMGCSLSANDIGLIDLIFKAHLAREDSFEMQLIMSSDSGSNIKERFGFFPKIKTITEIEEPLHMGPLVPRVLEGNAFKTWLTRKIEVNVPDPDDVNSTTHIKKVIHS